MSSTTQFNTNSSSGKVVSPTNSTTVAPPHEDYQHRDNQKATGGASEAELATNPTDPNTQARAEGLKGKNDAPLTEADFQVLDPLSHRPEGGEWQRE
ncbi:uncharacterized protein JCM6883_001626 [Sporobolomyces salmoneus]|uniref:uncharacterized protein n=1 Tax=Sporobolomyces salmoneus TaxID=183962 RepID=UPI00317AE1AD